jgi:hypothetical protein
MMGDHNRNKQLASPAALAGGTVTGAVLDAGRAGRSAGCASWIEVEADFFSGAAPRVGLTVVTPGGSPLQLQANGVAIGLCESRVASYMSGCIGEGFRFAGKIVRLSEDKRTGTVRLRGKRDASA